MMRLVANKWFWILLGLGLLLYWQFRRAVQAAMMAQASGQQAVVSAANANGYTTYNTGLYTPPAWMPFLKFFQANPYVPAPPQAATTQTH